MKKHLDFTIDFETCSLGTNAAPMQVAVVPWRRDADEDPFMDDDGFVVAQEVAESWPEPFVEYVDLRSCVVDGFEFDPETIKWWARQSETAKKAVCAGFPLPITDVLVRALDYIREIVAQYQLDSVCLWCQGEDVDIAILRSLCRRYDIDLEDTIPHTSFRDCRTVILEAAISAATKKRQMSGCDITEEEIFHNPVRAYDMYEPLPEEYANGSNAHDALYDATRSSWFTWQALKWSNR
jgi:hypothetical protein